ncbi:MAG: uroporphyrinogen decarboxylase family protein [Phycisphaerae bacterium]|nr:uroporphyrinogen decarboxylase family protein [Phycisphaerae bacterium]
MTPREQFIRTLTYQSVDRIPFVPGGPRESTLKRWRGEGLPEGVDWFKHVCSLLGIDPNAGATSGWPRPGLNIDFRMIPQFEEKVLEHAGGHYIVQDWKGNVCEIADTFDVTYLRTAKDFVTRRWIRCPVETRADWEAMKPRYQLDAPGRFPADLAAAGAKVAQREHVLAIVFNGPFWQLREWCGFEGLCFLMTEQPDFVHEMVEFWREFIRAMLARILAVAVPDHVLVNEDMAYKEHCMISPAMVRRFCTPSWRTWADQCRKAGVPVFDIDSDGYVGELIPLWIECGVNVNSPLEVAAGNDLPAFSRRYGKSMGYRGGVDKRAMAAGGQTLRDEMARLTPAIKAGGIIPGCDHGVPSDVSWQNMIDYCRQLAQVTGWL